MNDEDIERRIQEISDELSALRLQLANNRTGRANDNSSQQSRTRNQSSTPREQRAHARISTGFQDSGGRTIYLGDPVIYRPHGTPFRSRSRRVGYVHRLRGTSRFVYIRPNPESDTNEVYRAPNSITVTEDVQQ